MTELSLEEIEKSLTYIGKWPYSELYNHLDDAYIIIRSGFEEHLIAPEYAPKVVNGLIRYIMHQSSEQKLSEILDLFIRITSTDCDDATVRAIILTLVAQPKPNTQIDYGISVFIISQLLMQDRLHPVLIKVIKENLIEPDNDTTEILVRTLQRTIKDSQVIKKELYDLVFHVFELGSFWACDEIIHSLIDGIKNKKVVDLEFEHIPYLWARVHKAIYTAYTTPEYHPGYFTLIKSSAELIAILALTQQRPINELPAPLDDLSQPSSFAKKTKIRYLTLISNEIERFHQEICREQYPSDWPYFTATSSSNQAKIVQYYFGRLYQDWHNHWAEESQK